MASRRSRRISAIMHCALLSSAGDQPSFMRCKLNFRLQSSWRRAVGMLDHSKVVTWSLPGHHRMLMAEEVRAEVVVSSDSGKGDTPRHQAYR
jgi:hypothetical protein